MNGLGDQLFSRAALARNEYRRVRGGHPADCFKDIKQLRIFSYNVFKMILLV
ncbi:hypothetical protein D3C86_2107750 [compost metagenome]